MKTLITAIDPDKLNEVKVKDFHALDIRVYRNIRSINGLSPLDTLMLTDSQEIADSVSSEGFPVVGYEHDGIRLTCSEIILSPFALTPEYALELHNRMTGNQVSFRHGNIALYFLTEDEYVKFYDRFREETYMLAESGRNYTDEDVRAMYKKRVIQAQFTHNCGMFRVVPDELGETVGYGCVTVEQSETGSRTLISYYVFPECRRLGYGLSIVRTLVALIRSNDPSRDIYADIYTENVVSARILTKAGFRPVSPEADINNTDGTTPAGAPRETQEAQISHGHGHEQGTNGSRSLPQSLYCLPGRR